MVGLVDIAPAVAKVTVGKVEVPVYGVSAHGIAYLFGQYPELRALVLGKTVDVDRLVKLGPDVVVSIIAAGVGSPGDEATEDAARKQPVEVQVDFLEAILRITLPGGLRPLAERLNRLASAAGVEAGAPAARSGKAPASSSRKRSKR